MTMQRTGAVGPRASKEEFMASIGLDSRNPYHEEIYRDMRVSYKMEMQTQIAHHHIP